MVQEAYPEFRLFSVAPPRALPTATPPFVPLLEQTPLPTAPVLSPAPTSTATLTPAPVLTATPSPSPTATVLPVLREPCISYYDATLGDLKFVCRRFGNYWRPVQTVDSAGNVGLFSSLAFDAQSRAHIVYYALDTGDLKYARQSDSGWVVETVDAEGDVGYYPSLAIRLDGRAFISYYDRSLASVKVAQRGPDDTVWQIEVIETVGPLESDVGMVYAPENPEQFRTSIGLDARGYPIISYIGNFEKKLALLAAVIAWLGWINEVALLLLGGMVTLLARRGWQRFRPTALAAWLPLSGVGLLSEPSLVGLFWSFFKIGSVLYGSGYVLLAFLRAEFVDGLGWLTDQQLLDAVSIGQFTPGPLFTTATFIGYLLGGGWGAVLATLGIFLPAFLFVILSIPFLERLRQSQRLGAFLDGVNIVSLALMAVVSGQLMFSALRDWVTLAICLSALFLLTRTKINSAWLVGAGGLIGFWVTMAAGG